MPPLRSQAKDLDWTIAVKREIRKKAEKPKNDGKEKTVQVYITTGLRPADLQNKEVR